MTPEQVINALRRANDVARRTMALGRHPFGAVLVAPDGNTVLAEQGNVDSVNHAESTLARTVANNFTPEYLWPCTLVTIEVIGPVAAVEAEIAELHQNFWKH